MLTKSCVMLFSPAVLSAIFNQDEYLTLAVRTITAEVTYNS